MLCMMRLEYSMETTANTIVAPSEKENDNALPLRENIAMLVREMILPKHGMKEILNIPVRI